MRFKEIPPLKCNCIKLTLLVCLVMPPRLCFGADQLGPWTNWSVCQCAIDSTEGFNVRFRKPVPGSGIAYKCHLIDETCIQFEPCSCTLKKNAVDIMDNHRNKTSQIPADHGTPNESVVDSILDPVRKKRTAFYNYYDYPNDDYANDNYQGHTNTGHQSGSYHSKRNEFQAWNAGKSNPWESSRQNSHSNTHFNYNEYYGYGNGNEDYYGLNRGYPEQDVENYYDQYQYGAIDRGYPMTSNTFPTNAHMKHTGSGWNGVQGPNGGRFGHDKHRPIGHRNYYSDQSYDGYGQVPDLHYQRNDGYYGYERDSYVAHDVGNEAVPLQTVVKLQSSQQQILEEIRKLNERLLQSKEVMAHFTDEIKHLEELETRQEGGYSK
ncbi:hypothetical protein HOLleu_39035 [Holothuria leucospilota]|uniref:Uncharacterized protein n=1 Tax=Holothuria leucospilota TaxID=206669 RepID=A0A9Q0YHV1_HOLLE|nr:hypothetical protein HOLleu_39035 [Holothuria leucospilota]